MPFTRRTPVGSGAAARVAIHPSAETLLLAVSAWWLLVANAPFFAAALHGRAAVPSTWGFAAGLAALLFALHALLLGLLAHGRLLKPLLALLLMVGALAAHYMQRYGVYLDPSMLRNVAHTDIAEVRELLSWPLARDLLLYGGAPMLLLWRVQPPRRPWRRALLARAALLAGSAALAAGALLAVFQPFASLMRNRHEVRYLITPANALWSLGSALVGDARGQLAARRVLGEDAQAGPTWQRRARPMVVVLVIGETARAANWGLNGYARPTTPELARLPVVNFADASSCGTDTGVSLPCMFAPVGRRDYDPARLRGSESVLHALARAGVAVHWRDNQSGCKGVCDGLPYQHTSAAATPALCDGGRCLDGALFDDLGRRLDGVRAGTQLWVLHQLGNHGPAYYRRYPRAFARFQPACASDDLQACSREAIVNAYDNALLYTDHLLAGTIATLQANAERVDSALLYLSDHGESLGEHGLYLHGLPYAIAPDVQKRVPMLLWSSVGFADALGLDAACLLRRAAQPVSHDHLAHTLLGLFDVQTALYEPAWDLTLPCRAPQRLARGP